MLYGLCATELHELEYESLNVLLNWYESLADCLTATVKGSWYAE
jgi:hypothetical protein